MGEIDAALSMRPFGLAILDQLVCWARNNSLGCFYTVSETIAHALFKEKLLFDLALKVIDELGPEGLADVIFVDVAMLVSMEYLEGSTTPARLYGSVVYGDLPPPLVAALTHQRLWISVALP